MKYGQNSTVKLYNDFTDLGNAWSHSVQSHGTSTEVSSQVRLSNLMIQQDNIQGCAHGWIDNEDKDHNASTQMVKLDGEVKSQVNQGGQQSDEQGTSTYDLIDKSNGW